VSFALSCIERSVSRWVSPCDTPLDLLLLTRFEIGALATALPNVIILLSQLDDVAVLQYDKRISVKIDQNRQVLATLCLSCEYEHIKS
jgi:hypothetical protein